MATVLVVIGTLGVFYGSDAGFAVGLIVLGFCLGAVGAVAVAGSRNNARAWIQDDRIEYEKGWGARYLANQPLVLNRVKTVFLGEWAIAIVSRKENNSPFYSLLRPRKDEFPAVVARLRLLLQGAKWKTWDDFLRGH